MASSTRASAGIGELAGIDVVRATGCDPVRASPGDADGAGAAAEGASALTATELDGRVTAGVCMPWPAPYFSSVDHQDSSTEFLSTTNFS
ncbi:unannotated protein [freshwater metagenome]|uniref:Unannotated protein n=1 Tax=freshwater metagenome TaxID=449393 RepID=A0A6J7G9H8_9ZZZZ